MSADTRSAREAAAASNQCMDLSILRTTIAGATSLAALFVLCWIGAAVTNLQLSHMFIALFTTAPVESLAALAIGLCSSLLFGALAGLLIAWSYNLLGFLDRGGSAS